MRLTQFFSLVFTALLATLHVSAQTVAETKEPTKIVANHKVATVSPITFSLSQALLAGTDIAVDYLPPTRLPINRIASWLDKNRTQVFDAYDAFVTIRSLRPELDFYPSLRSANIRVVPIDVAVALVPGGEQVARRHADEAFWLNTNNLLMMLGILKRDLNALWPHQQTQIEQNYQHTTQAIRRIAMAINERLFTLEYDGLVNATDTTEALTQSLMMPTFSQEESQGLHVLTVATRSKQTQDIWLIDDFTRYSEHPITSRWESILNALPD